MEKFRGDSEPIKKKQMEILELKNMISESKNHWIKKFYSRLEHNRNEDQ